VSRYQEGKTNLDFTEARDSEWQWHQLGHMEVRTSLQTDNHSSTPPLSFLHTRYPSCHPTNSIKALKAQAIMGNNNSSSYNDTVSYKRIEPLTIRRVDSLVDLSVSSSAETSDYVEVVQ